MVGRHFVVTNQTTNWFARSSSRACKVTSKHLHLPNSRILHSKIFTSTQECTEERGEAYKSVSRGTSHMGAHHKILETFL